VVGDELDRVLRASSFAGLLMLLFVTNELRPPVWVTTNALALIPAEKVVGWRPG
jgi:hypothetical protein